MNLSFSFGEIIPVNSSAILFLIINCQKLQKHFKIVKR